MCMPIPVFTACSGIREQVSVPEHNKVMMVHCSRAAAHHFCKQLLPFNASTDNVG